MNKNIEIQKDKIADFCRRHHICRLAIFGSALRDDFEQGSDVDVLVDFEPGRSRADLDTDRRLNLSLVRLLEIIGEAARELLRSR